jgi:hypothetical protein
MKWLVTTAAGADLARLGEELAAAGGTLAEGEPIPLGDGGAHDLAVPAEGPADLPQRLRDSETVLDVYPDSELELYSSA